MEAAQLFHGNTKKHDIPLDHLDFTYIKGCSDVKHLEKILRVLRSKEEGFYPQLEKCCEGRLEELHPNSRLLRKESPLYSKGDLDRMAREELDNDLKNWTSSMNNIESNFEGQSDFMDNDDQELPPIRSGNITLTTDGVKSVKPQTTDPKKKAMPREYRDWDKIDIDKELEKVDEPTKKLKEKTVIGNREVTNIPDKIDAKGLSDSEKLLKANREKDKGNEAFRSNDFKEAITYYSRSISLQPTAASYNNRALAYLKTSDWQKAINDTDTVLKLEPGNVKALLRRGTAYKGLKKLQKAKADIENVLKIEPNNKKAEELLQDIEKDSKEKKKTGRRMVIEEVDGEDEDETAEKIENSNVSSPQGDNSKIESAETENKEKIETNSANSSGDKIDEKPKRRMEIIEVDSESEDEEEGEVIVNGHASGEDNNIPEVTNELVQNEIEMDNDRDVLGSVQSEAKVETVESEAEGKVTEETVDDKSNEAAKGDDTSDGRNSPVAATYVKSDTDSAEEDETTVDPELAEEEKSVPTQELKRPVFYLKEMSEKTLVVKEEATKLFKSGQYGEASHKYSKVISILENDESQIVNLSLMYSNRAACYLKTGDLPGAVKDCNSSLDLIPHSVKPLLRRAMANEHLERFRPAYIDYRHVLLLDSKMDHAHLGTKRCQQMLLQKDGPRWREKVNLTKFSPFEVPDIIGLDGKSTSQPAYSHLQTNSQSQPNCTNMNQSQPTFNNQSKESINESASSSSKETEKTIPVTKQESGTAPESKKLSPQEQFDALKSEGNEQVKQGKFKEAIECYDKCEAVLPGQVAVYTNRALCYIRTNRGKKAEEDCSMALLIEKDNVKALFRRAQARKMLKRYREGIEDLKHLLKVDTKNSAAKKEMELLKNYWREELENMKKNIGDLEKNIGDLKNRKEELIEQTTGSQKGKAKTRTHSSKAKTGAQSGKEKTASQAGIAKTGSQAGTAKTGSQASTAKTGAQNSGKERKRMVIQEVDSEEESKPTETSSKSSDSKSGVKNQDSVPKVEVINSETNESKSIPVGKQKDSKPVNSQTGSSKKDTKPSQKKSAIKETSQGLPTVPQTAPKLDKATPYEFISAWNALKKAENVKPYYDLLKQIKPSDIKTVISNKLDGNMLNVITRCVSEHYLPNGEEETGYELLKNLSILPRFGTVSMFMSGKEKSDVKAVLTKLESLPSKTYSQEDITKLREKYSV